MDIKKLSEKYKEEIYSNLKSQNFNVMSEEMKNEYVELYSLYSSLFVDYLIKEFKLNEYDEKVQNSNLIFNNINEKDMDIYQYLSRNKLKFFYVRNNLHVEKLKKEENEYLKEKIEKSDFELDEKSENIIKNTFKDIIFEDLVKDGSVYDILYGPNSSSFLAPNNSLVLGFRYDEFKYDELNDEEWYDLNKKQGEYMSFLFNQLKVDLEENTKMPVNIIKYTEYSV